MAERDEPFRGDDPADLPLDDELDDDLDGDDDGDDGDDDGDDGHRGAFGEFGGETTGLLERAFRERIVLVGVATGSTPVDTVEHSLDELALLVDTAGADVVDRVLQRRDAPDPATYIGKGKARELHEIAQSVDADTVVFDDELTPAQQFNLEKAIGRSAIDRTAVILDIFAQHAHSTEGKAQVELAQLRYRLPRFRGRGKNLSQQAGGLGGARRGPGETQLEVDRRRILRRIHKLERDLRDISQVRETQSKARRRSRLAAVALVGYTNAGKSTLLNRLTDAGVLVEDRLFATVDATTRRLQLPGGEAVLLSDTVGFVRKLPHQLVEAFKSTLSVVTDADLLVHVVDGAAPGADDQIAAVHEVLAEIGADRVPELLVVNKSDLAPDAARAVARRHEPAVVISAASGEGIDDLLGALADRLRRAATVVELHVPYARGDVLAAIHREGEVLAEEHDSDHTVVRARLDDAGQARFREWQVAG